ncbi:MAG: 50S ribosomal protein L4 [Zetaproteobacteria bacterium CG12_big_fil_rev_8_21_14_0_65_54_13]|nr:MAG: 50S ribosomal protein L4 [Zetaproteobacteria bacterium CG23_combo_of_CG06-09_8_20_14_all_54_7]PIW49108.1 MAG: 50S ribosomal protein L4 [Zetaproteobacteria bacterium CG12_big_fil_rev_8_21_14_0_65_54_13]PIX55895.1 MAG: 50S ribosomal protein L4 [Zetaproteobacteria bacterium CG_4_10_14_3_um_filter_54_28]PJA30491.1 MAG: 50S ribosomal protein L4 [Zetaproteobacteria bacterium CG_4_9_14_3_um_filter_54_145]
MAEITIVNQSNKEVGKRELNPAVFGLEADAAFVHRVYAALASAQRGGTSKVKDRSEVSGGGKKPWKQKGTGRARAGSSRQAQWRHGGTAHGPNADTSFATRINKKERRRALCLALSDCLREGKLTFVDTIDFDEIKTKAFVETLNALGTDSGLIVLGENNSAVELSGRNVPNTQVKLDGQISLHDLLKSKRIVLTAAAVDNLEERLA